jgi:hypothetical protein
MQDRPLCPGTISDEEGAVMSLRKRLEKSETLAAAIAWPLAGYLRLVSRTGRWQVEGLEELRAELARGPVIVVFWHGRLMMAGPAWPLRPARTVLPVAPSPAGLLSARTQAHFGSTPVVIDHRRAGMANIRALLGAVRKGNSLGLTADGPKGPARQAKSAPIEWAQATGRPVFLFSWSSPAAVRLNTWDGLMIPRPFSRGVYGYRKWKDALPRKLSPAERARLQGELTEALDSFDRDMDRLAGLPPQG